MSEHFPIMDIHFPPEREKALHDEMTRRAVPPWSTQEHDALGRPTTSGSFYFHRAVVTNSPSCTVCIHRDNPGHWIINAIVPDEGQNPSIPLETYKEILREFESMIAEPSVEAVSGMCAIQLSKYRLEDYFSPHAVKLLEAFCLSSNHGDLGSHPSDQWKWISFLLAAFDDDKNIHCDIFGNCLKTAQWWPENGIADLVHEYDFAMRLLRQSGRSVGLK